MQNYTKDYYKILNVNVGDTQAEIKKAYHNLSKKYHPDTGCNTEFMKEINEAYSVLSSIDSLSAYNSWYFRTYKDELVRAFVLNFNSGVSEKYIRRERLGEFYDKYKDENGNVYLLRENIEDQHRITTKSAWETFLSCYERVEALPFDESDLLKEHKSFENDFEIKHDPNSDPECNSEYGAKNSVEKKQKNTDKVIAFIAISIMTLVIVAMFIFALLPPFRLEVEHEPFTFQDINHYEKIDYSITPFFANDDSVELISTNPNIAVFDGDVLCAKSEGTTYIYARSGDRCSEGVLVTVRDKQAENWRAALPIMEAINDIGKVSLNSQAAIEKAENMYENASSAVRYYVSNADKLTQARSTYQGLKAKKKAAASSKTSSSAKSSSSYSASDNIVYIGNTGECYHYQSCHTLQGNGRAITMEEAKRMGRRSCRICKR